MLFYMNLFYNRTRFVHGNGLNIHSDGIYHVLERTVETSTGGMVVKKAHASILHERIA
jgi:hypothetical protein